MAVKLLNGLWDFITQYFGDIKKALGGKDALMDPTTMKEINHKNGNKKRNREGTKKPVNRSVSFILHYPFPPSQPRRRPS